jgi:lauroyl/myristoyl acyltransferase
MTVLALRVLKWMSALPYPVLRFCGNTLGIILYWLAGSAAPTCGCVFRT